MEEIIQRKNKAGRPKQTEEEKKLAILEKKAKKEKKKQELMDKKYKALAIKESRKVAIEHREMPELKGARVLSKNIDAQFVCTACGEDKLVNFYMSFNPMHAVLKKVPVCKKCIENTYMQYFVKLQDSKMALYFTCRKFDIFYSNSSYNGALKQVAKAGWTVVQSYFKLINSFRDKDYEKKNGYGVCFDESYEFLDRIVAPTYETVEEDELTIEQRNARTPEDIQNEKDVIRLLREDPFINENQKDRKYLFNKLIDFLDSDTLLDNFKKPIVLEIVKSFNQIEKINQALANIDVSKIKDNILDVKNLMHTKTTTLNNILAMAKDNGISANHNNNKSKGAGTLTGMIKELQEKGIHSAQVNLYDIETCEGMKQIADISNRSILEQIRLTESDYEDMLKSQRDLIQDYGDKASKFEEENRLLKVKMKQIEDFLNQHNIKIIEPERVIED